MVVKVGLEEGMVEVGLSERMMVGSEGRLMVEVAGLLMVKTRVEAQQVGAGGTR